MYENYKDPSLTIEKLTILSGYSVTDFNPKDFKAKNID